MTKNVETDATEMHQAPFREAAGWAADYEMHLRMLASKVPALHHVVTARAEDTEEAIIKHFAAQLKPAEVEAMRLTRRLRNKLLHGELIQAREKLAQLGHPPGQPIVRKLDLPNLSTSKTPVEDLITAVGAGGEHLSPAAHPIEDNLLGWLLQSAFDGTFTKGVQSFQKGIAIVCRLTDTVD